MCVILKLIVPPEYTYAIEANQMANMLLPVILHDAR